MTDVFISYSRQDLQFAEKLFEALKARNISAWVDWQNIPRSAGWWDEIKRGIDTASTLLFLTSDASLSSAVCTLELAHAIANGKRIIPVINEMPNFEATFGKIAAVRPDDVLNEILEGRDLLLVARDNRSRISHINWVFFNADAQGRTVVFEEAIEELIKTVNTDLDHNRKHARLLIRAREWEQGKKDDDLLLIGDEIIAAEAWLADADSRGVEPTPTQLQRDYIATSRQVEEARHRHLRSLNRRAMLAAGLAVLMIAIAVFAGIAAGNEFNNAQIAQNEANAAKAEVISANASLTPIPLTVDAQNTAVAAANDARATATVGQGNAQATATQIPPTLTQAAVIAQQAEEDQAIALQSAQASLDLADGRTLQALARMNAAIAVYPENALAYVSRGLIHARIGNYELAIADFTQAIRLDPQYVVAYSNRGAIYTELDDYERAIADFDYAIRLDPQFADSYYNRGAAYADLGDYERAIADFTEAIRLAPQYVPAYHNRGLAYFQLHDYERAIADFTQAIRLDPQAATYTSRGNAYFELGDYQRAITDYDEAIRLDPQDAEIYYNRGVAYTDSGNHEQAIADFTEAIRLNPQFVDAYYNRGMAYLQLGNHEQAIADFTEAIRLDPQAADAYFRRGMAYLQLGNYEQAIADFTEAARLAPQDASPYYTRGLAYLQLDNHEQAIADFTEALRLNPQFADAYTNRGIAYAILGDYEQAIADFTEALRLNPQFADAYTNRGIAYADSGDYEQAIADFTEAIRLNPQDADAYFYRGLSYFSRVDTGNSNDRRSDLEQALSDWRQAEELGYELPPEVEMWIEEIEAELPAVG